MKTRSQAGKACSEGRVFVNDVAARAAHSICIGDIVRFRDLLSRFEEEVRILALPEGNVSKSEARACYESRARRVLSGPGYESG